MGSASTSQLAFKSASMASTLICNFEIPFKLAWMAMLVWAIPTPIFLNTVESVKSRCQRDTGSFSAKKLNKALAMPTLPSEFSKSIGLTLCGMVEEPTSPAITRCLK